MPWNSTSAPLVNAAPSRIFQFSATILCVLFGIALIANTQVSGDGMWYWYATLLRSGHHLYSEMHLALQPLFVLETSWIIALLGKGWLVSKVPAALHLIAYCVGLFLVVDASSLSDKSKAAVLAATFFISIAFEAYRFDDYHVLADCFEVYSIVLLLRLRSSQGSQGLYIAAALGLLSGLALTTRLNDGGALFVGVAISLLCLAPAKKPLLTALFVVSAALTVVLIVRLTHDSFHDYATYSIFKAAGSKGGAGNVLAYPLRLPWNALRWWEGRWHQKWPVYSVAAALSWGLLVSSPSWRQDRRKIWKPILGLCLILLPLPFVQSMFLETWTIDWMAAVGTLATYAFGIIVSARLCYWIVQRKSTWDTREILLLIPLGQLASSSMSSGGRHIGLFGPLAIVLLLLPISSPVRVRSRLIYSSLMALMIIVLANCALYKVKRPYGWHSYRAKPMFTGRQWYHHPEYGPMILETQQLELFQNICNSISSGQEPRNLLSLPFPYANYFCSIPPWHNYVQTFYDTSSRDTIFGLTDELLANPPHWIVYQRQLDNMTLHEETYYHGKPLPHRYLDQVIEEKLKAQAWQTVLSSTYGQTESLRNEWLLIRTQPPPVSPP